MCTSFSAEEFILFNCMLLVAVKMYGELGNKLCVPFTYCEKSANDEAHYKNN